MGKSVNSVSDLELISFVDSNTRDDDDPKYQFPPRLSSRSRHSAWMPHCNRFFSAVSPEGPAPITHHFNGLFDSHADIFDD
jgi:hypothetical protein